VNPILSSYPLTRDSLSALSRSGSQLIALTLSELRVLPLAKILATMRGTRGAVLTIVVQEASERAVLPLMLTLASLAGTDRIEVNDLASGTVKPVSRVKAALGFLGTIGATLSGVASLLHLHLRCLGLMKAAPLAFGLIQSEKALYLKSNLMLGVKAGGSIGHIAGVANELFSLDHGMLVLAPEPPPMVKPDARFTPIEALRSYGIPPEANHFRFNRNCVKTASRVLSQETFGFIYQRLSLGNLAGVLLSRRFKLPLVLEYNGSEVWISSNWGHSLKFKKLASLVEDVCLRHAHRIVTVSQVLADELKARGVPAEKIVWYPNCIDPEMFDPARYADVRAAVRQRLGIADDELSVMFLGTFGVWHGAEVLADTVRRCVASQAAREPNRPRLRFVFVGDGLRRAAVQSTLKAEIASGDVILTGLVPQAEAPQYLAAADIFVSPHVPSTDGTKFFGSPTKLFEYMAMEKAIVASDLDQLGEVLRPAITEQELKDTVALRGDEIAVLTEPGSADAMLRALLFLRDRPDFRNSLAQAARKRALAQYTWKRHVQVIMQSLH
jgi:glycosyltransferase involved in cell wall biosynthesis